MTTSSVTLIGLAIGAAILLWLVFSVLKKVVGLIFIAAIAITAAILWLNPELASQLWVYFQSLAD